MLVIHPKDKTTAVLSALYQGAENVRLVDQDTSNPEVKRLLNHLPCQERLLLLGHGSDKGLFSRDDGGQADFGRLMVYHPHAYYLRKHGGNTVALWCNADLFARKEGLHGLFSGMIISELDEAKDCHVPTTREELERETAKLARRLRSLLDAEVPMHEVPALMLELDDVHSPLTTFNYRNFYYL